MDLLYGSRRLGAPRLLPAIDREAIESIDPAELRRRLLAEPLYRRRLLSDDARTTALIARLNEAGAQDQNRDPLLAHVRRAVAPLEATGWSVLISGSPAVRHSYARLLREDFLRLTPLALLVLAAALLLMFRHWSAVLLTFAIVSTALVWTLAAMALLGWKVTLLTPSLPVIVMVLGSSDAIHVLARLGVTAIEDRKRAATDGSGNLEQTFRALTPALRLTTATTAAGFLALAATSIPMLRQFGGSAALGALGAFAATLTLGPALLTLRRPRSRPPQHPARPRLDPWIVRHPGRVIAGVLACALLPAACGLPLARVESRVVDDVARDHAIAAHRRAVEDAMGGNLPMTFLIHPRPAVRAGGEGPVPLRLLHALSDFQQRLQHDSHGYLSSAVSAFDLYSMFWRGLGGGSELPETPLDTRRLAAMIGKEALSRWLDPASGQLRMELLVYDRGTAATEEFLERARRAFEGTLGGRADLEVSGFVHLAQRLHRQVVANTLKGFALSFALVTLLLALALRSGRLTLLALLPNLLPLTALLGVMGLAGIDLRVSSCIVVAAVFGISVDDTVHFLTEYRRQRLRGLAAAPAVTATRRTAGRGILATSLILAAGFTTLLAGQFGPSRVVGALVALTTLFALLADLVLLPALLIRFDREARCQSL